MTVIQIDAPDLPRTDNLGSMRRDDHPHEKQREE
jgi:hypothetical protein